MYVITTTIVADAVSPHLAPWSALASLRYTRRERVGHRRAHAAPVHSALVDSVRLSRARCSCADCSLLSTLHSWQEEEELQTVEVMLTEAAAVLFLLLQLTALPVHTHAGAAQAAASAGRGPTRRGAATRTAQQQLRGAKPYYSAAAGDLAPASLTQFLVAQADYTMTLDVGSQHDLAPSEARSNGSHQGCALSPSDG